MQALTICPVASAVDATNFVYYKSGVYSQPSCPNTDHGIGIVGYGETAQKIPYYILKNTWGPNWGINGYMWILRGVNMCQIATYPSYVVV